MLKSTLIAIIAAAGLYGLYSFYVPQSVRQNTENQDYQQTRQFLASKQYLLAYQIARQYSNKYSEANNKTKMRNWLDLAIESLERLPGDAPDLESIYRQFPQAFLKHERASQIVGSYYLSMNDLSSYREIRKAWDNGSHKPEYWVVLDADEMVLEGKRIEAFSYLNSHAFEGPADALRLLRLSLMTSEKNPILAWEYFNLAKEKDPDNQELDAYKAKILKAGQTLVNQ